MRARHTSRWATSMGVMLVVLVAALGVLIAYKLMPDTDSVEVSKEPLIINSTSEPDESKANATSYKWKGSSVEPKRLIIKSIGVDSFIQKAGVDQNKQVAVPSNIHLTGWFADSTLPGRNGLAIIDGHLGGRTMPGVFEKLDRLKNGDSFQIELGSGSVLHYTVINVVSVSEEKSASYLFSQSPSVKSQVNLITCAGEYDSDAKTYKDRVVVSGKLEYT